MKQHNVAARRKVALEQVERRIKEKKPEGMTKEEHQKRIDKAKEEKATLEKRIGSVLR